MDFCHDCVSPWSWCPHHSLVAPCHNRNSSRQSSRLLHYLGSDRRSPITPNSPGSRDGTGYPHCPTYKVGAIVRHPGIDFRESGPRARNRTWIARFTAGGFDLLSYSRIRIGRLMDASLGNAPSRNRFADGQVHLLLQRRKKDRRLMRKPHSGEWLPCWLDRQSAIPPVQPWVRWKMAADRASNPALLLFRQALSHVS